MFFKIKKLKNAKQGNAEHIRFSAHLWRGEKLGVERSRLRSAEVLPADVSYTVVSSIFFKEKTYSLDALLGMKYFITKNQETSIGHRSQIPSVIQAHQALDEEIRESFLKEMKSEKMSEEE